MKNQRTLYHFILDKSGSMGDVREETVSLFNKQVDTIKKMSVNYPAQDFYTGLTTFNDRVEHEVDFKPSDNLDALRFERYRPDGLTSLYDAIGTSVSRIKERFGDAIRNDRMSVVVVILTDGHENASVQFGSEEIAQLIKELEKTEKWSFTILGADFEITSVSSKLNFQVSSSREYSKISFCEIEDDVEESIRSYADKKSKGIIDKDFIKSKNK